MKKIVITNPIFTPSTRTIDTKIIDFDIRKLYAIINTSTGNLIYATGVSGKGFSSVIESTIVLEFDTASMNSSDILQFLYDDDEGNQWLQNIYESVEKLGFLNGVRGPAANLRVTVTDGGVAVTSGTISNVNTFGGTFIANQMIPSTVNIGAIQSNINNIQVNIS
jgi:hypothetical protein